MTGSPMLTMNDLSSLLDHRSRVVTDQGDKVGSIGEVYLHDSTDEPVWVTVHTGLFGTKESFVPLRGAAVKGDQLVVGYPRDLIKHAPSVDRDGHLSPEEETALYRHYDLAGPASSDSSASAMEERDDDGEPWMMRSEERLRIGTERYEAARVRLRKYVVTEQATTTVPLRKEELRIEVEPITRAAGGGSDGEVPFQEQSVEVVLREELAVVSKETVPVERVRLDKATVTGRTTVREQVRKERIASSVEGEASLGAAGTGASESSTGQSSASPFERADEQSSKIVTNTRNALVKGKKRR